MQPSWEYFIALGKKLTAQKTWELQIYDTRNNSELILKAVEK